MLKLQTGRGADVTSRTQSVSKTRQERQPFDAYNTPFDCALAICRWLKEKGIDPERVLEPSAGHGDFVRAVRETWPQAFIVANEIQEKLVEKPVMREYLLACAAAKKVKQPAPVAPVPMLNTREVLMAAGANEVLVLDFLAFGTPPVGTYSLVIGNPPFSLGGGAAAHTAKGIELLSPGGVLAFLMKMHFRGTEARIKFWNRYAIAFSADPPIVPRPDFTGDGRDTSEYTLFCFHRLLENAHWKIHCAPAIEWRKQ